MHLRLKLQRIDEWGKIDCKLETSKTMLLFRTNYQYLFFRKCVVWVSRSFSLFKKLNTEEPVAEPVGSVSVERHTLWTGCECHTFHWCSGHWQRCISNKWLLSIYSGIWRYIHLWMHIDMWVSDLFLSNSRPVSPVTDGWWSYFGLEEKEGGREGGREEGREGGRDEVPGRGRGRERGGTFPLNMRELAA